MSVKTTDPAPTIQLSPIFTPSLTIEFAPIQVKFETFTAPHKTAPGDICTESSIMQSCSTIEPEFRIQLLPIEAFGFIIAPAQTTVPSAIVTSGEIMAVG